MAQEQKQDQEDLGLSNRMSSKLPRLPPPAYFAQIPPPGFIRLNQAENNLLRSELLEIGKDAISEEFTESAFDYPRGFGGDPKLRDGLASLFNTYFNPSMPVETEHISVAAGSGNSIDALLCTICDEGDIVLTPGPAWNGFYVLGTFHASVTILPSPSPDFRNSLGPDCVDRLVATYDSHPEKSRIKALLVCNPHNPCDDTYAPSTLLRLMDFCHQRNLHYISDEVGALSAFNATPEKPFTSALSLVGREGGIKRSRVHVLWSFSKDFGSAGMRLACLVSQANKALIDGVTWSSWWQVSILSSIYATAILTSSQLPKLIELNNQRLKNAYELITSTLEKWDVEYIPVRAGMTMFIRVAKDAKSWEEEMAAVAKLKEAGVLVVPGKSYGVNGEMGWARVLFAVKEDVMKDALEKMGTVLAPKDRQSDSKP